MIIQPLPIFQDNYIWLMINPEIKSVIAVDPGDAKPVYITKPKIRTDGRTKQQKNTG